MKKLLLSASALVAMLTASNAQVISIASTGSSVYSQNFNGLSTTTINATFSSTSGNQTQLSAISGLTGVDGWYGSKIAGSGSSATNFISDNGTLNTGSIYSYGAAADSDRALGAIASGTNTMGYGALFKNDTLTTLDELTFTLTGEFWRSSTGTQNVLTFGYGKVDGVTVTNANFLTTTSATIFSALNIVGPAPVPSNGALNGNDPANQLSLSGVTLSGVALAPGETLFIRWQDTNETGNDAGLAIDNFALGAAVPEPQTWALIGLGAFFMIWNLRRKRRFDP